MTPLKDAELEAQAAAREVQAEVWATFSRVRPNLDNTRQSEAQGKRMLNAELRHTLG